ncbi:APO protein 3, mitochondrial-like [Lotus japonicus]|uniref:APO protein 3, mitochondrial-like n=1 Tax=Lotus japonicus TaxID=34305 RepID=UPI00258AD79D|nr:APO protein 3, mitochondrial-like [Lotus japonicus]XP_057445549.1 APO protein 3, mitochondrial-like [Lotus japonicus]XP_057445550.1 APO protein 3, mitochondrial-like [Lotus japonicus]XP_057445551.1 APO protein 3, mitochondrial-like [Lotus japonicus]XP_057445552.1 APO protein 3, mitochondrial-like [Lotus japonicus]XP_057445553.1 APO protein 3, mitochondrial-like [Lotus japonicus]
MMLPRHVQTVRYMLERLIPVAQLRGINTHFCVWYSTVSACNDLPRNLKMSERKPLVTSFNELKRQARRKRKERQNVHEILLQPPENGLLVKQLIPIAHQVYAARSELLSSVSRLVKHIAIYTCNLCGDVHVGHPPHNIRTCNVRGSPSSKEHSWVKGGIGHVLPLVESFHLYDRIGRAVSHNEMLEVDRIPAIVELCIQAGFDIPEYPTRRRAFPVYCVAGRIIDFEKRFPKEISLGKDIDACGFWCKKRLNEDTNSLAMHGDDIQAIAVRGMKAWEKMCSGASKLMDTYAVQTCGYCPEVQVGPKGHRVRNCQAFKHQMRDGQHAWQEATINDLVPPVYVYHIGDQQSGKPLVHELKRYYGMLPAVVELFAQAGATAEKNYAHSMREDVVVPEMDEEKLVV